jgi:hypothetical protein
MSDRRQVLQEAEKALEAAGYFGSYPERLRIGDDPTWNGSAGWSYLRAARSALALIRASLAEGDPPETTVTEAMVDAAVTEWRSWCRAMPPTFVDNHPRDGIRRALQAALTAKEQA